MQLPSSAEVIPPNTSSDGEADLYSLLQVLWHQKWVVASSILIFATSAAIYALNATVWYRADVLMVQAANRSSTVQLGALGSLASLAGISDRGIGGSQIPIAVLKSRDFARDFIVEEKIEEQLRFANGKDSLRILPYHKSRADIRDAVRFFDEEVRFVGEDKKTGLVSLSINWTDPDVGAKWANSLVVRVNSRLRKQALDEAERNINYLRAEIATTTVASLQQSMSKVLESEMQKMLMARGNDEFAFNVIDRAISPSEKLRPKRSLLVAGGALLGLLFGCGVALVRQVRVNRRSASDSR
jgi:uncharacterized protein involved in exopolysaccharide biosynthesis